MRALIVAVLFILALALGFWLGLVMSTDEPAKPVKWRTHYQTVEKTVPGPERTVEKTVPGPETTVFKRKPGGTTWIIVCGEKTQRVEGNKPITECNLPDTGGG